MIAYDAHLFCFHKCAYDTDGANDEDTKCIIIIVVHKPQNYTENLKDIERIQHLR